MLKELAQLNEAVTPSKFYAVVVDFADVDTRDLIDKIFGVFGYADIGTADEFLDDEQQENLNGSSNLPHLSDIAIFAKNGLTTNSFKNDSELVHQLYKDIDAHDYLGV